ncbi:hypothetical protein BJ165DRAFT_343771 [Panaeolus papilionaceus]|nr:hypothetical protein BJ165DRAFT_343771 [Panaeolus papilionaceus]
MDVWRRPGPESVQPSRIITMAHLQTLTLNVTHVSDCIDILSHISYPPSTKIKLEFECLGPESNDEWYGEDQIRELIVPRLGSCLRISFLSNPFIVSSDTPTRTTSERAVLAIEIGTSHLYHAKCLSTWTQLVYKAWFDDIDFGAYLHPSSSHASSSSNQIPDPAMFISAATENSMPTMEEVRKVFLPLLPLPKLRPIALDEELSLEFFKELGELPNLEVISMNGRSAIAFVSYTSGVYTAIKSGNAAGLQEAFVGAAFNAGHELNRTPFPSLKSLIFENADFGSQY